MVWVGCGVVMWWWDTGGDTGETETDEEYRESVSRHSPQVSPEAFHLRLTCAASPHQRISPHHLHVRSHPSLCTPRLHPLCCTPLSLSHSPHSLLLSVRSSCAPSLPFSPSSLLHSPWRP